MTSTSINRFLYMRRHDMLEDDVTWCAYDFEAAAKPRHVKMALKQLGLRYAGELGVSHFMALYEVPDRKEAETVLSQWWLWRGVSMGARLPIPLRAQEGVSGGYPTSLAGKPA